MSDTKSVIIARNEITTTEGAEYVLVTVERRKCQAWGNTDPFAFIRTRTEVYLKADNGIEMFQGYYDEMDGLTQGRILAAHRRAA